MYEKYSTTLCYNFFKRPVLFYWYAFSHVTIQIRHERNVIKSTKKNIFPMEKDKHIYIYAYMMIFYIFIIRLCMQRNQIFYHYIIVKIWKSFHNENCTNACLIFLIDEEKI